MRKINEYMGIALLILACVICIAQLANGSLIGFVAFATIVYVLFKPADLEQ